MAYISKMLDSTDKALTAASHHENHGVGTSGGLNINAEFDFIFSTEHICACRLLWQ